ncbi:MAG: spermidine synthase [Armatimonadota bacterium]
MAEPRGGSWRQAALIWLVFCCGVAVMGLEMCASRLIAPYFGSTLAVWTSLIGLVLVFLTAGYYLGGALADRYASRFLLGAIVTAAGAITLALPVASQRVLGAAWALTPKAGILASSLVGTFALFSLPMVLLGCVCPFAMKLTISDLGRTGRTAGHIYAVSALGSVVGTFLPALFMIDAWGVRHSIMAFGALLVIAGLLLIRRLSAAPAAAPIALLLLPLPPMLPAHGAIAREESPYNYLQVIAAGDNRILVTDWGGYSVYLPGQFRTHQYYDYLLLAPLLRSIPPNEWLRDVLIIGLGAGTASKQITQAYGPLSIDGVEIDHDIVALGRQHFAMDEPNLRVHVTDGRAFLGTSGRNYDWVIVDAYQGSDIPFHLVTAEFFRLIHDHLRPGGVLAINIAWWSPDDSELLDRITASVRTVFPSIYTLTGISEQSGAVLLAGGDDSSPDRLVHNAAAVGHDGLLETVYEVVSGQSAQLAEAEAGALPLTDDCAPVSRIADRSYRRHRQQAYSRERQAVSFDP